MYYSSHSIGVNTEALRNWVTNLDREDIIQTKSQINCFKNPSLRGTCLAQSVENATLGLWAMSLSPILSVEIT